MNIPEEEVESILRHAPRMKAPPELKSRLIAEAQRSNLINTPETAYKPPAHLSWLRRWWPVFAPGMASLACAVVFTFQHLEIQDLERSVQALSASAAQITEAKPQPADKTGDDVSSQAIANQQAELERLRTLAAQLAGEVAHLEQMRAENAKLRAQLATPQIAGFSPEEAEALAKAKEKALSISCINNLKQFGLAVRIWAVDNNHILPPDILSMSNELSTPKILVCPAETSRQAARDWSSFTPGNLSYEYLAPSDSESEPTRTL